jgi:S-DNA-T family DNA segregation ATPase FtsK/SpoIIIE
MMLGTLLAMLEFRVHATPYMQRTTEGGGLVGYWLVSVLDTSIGRPAAILVVTMLMLVGALLTFNITLYELFSRTGGWLVDMWEIAWSGTTSQPEEPQHTPTRQKRTKGKDALAFEAPPQAADGADDMEPTPIAARLTRASLFKRFGSATPEPQPASEAEAPQQAQPKKPDKKAEQPAPTTETEEDTPARKPAPSRAKATRAEKAAEPNKSAEDEPQAAEEPQEEAEPEVLAGIEGSAIHRAWPMPSLDLLDQQRESTINEDEVDRTIQARSLLIEETLHSFKVEARVVGVNPGPAVTQFEVQPAVGVKISKITTLEKDLALALAAPSIRIEAPIPGKSAVGIEIPNTAIAMVSLREVIDSEEFDASKGKLKLPLGKDIGGNPVVADMTRMPHLLVAGSTGSGKSVAINSFLSGLLLTHTPEALKLILVDPKMVELIVYNRIPHLLSPVVTELERVVPTLKWATREMERRYKVFARHGCRNLESYKQLGQRRADLEPMPYILIVIDELADLIMMAPDEVETYICRLAQMARATGIHLIIATQRPSVDVITGLIKANFPSRIAFAVTSQVDSRVILDTPGAERLLGRGDMLYIPVDSAKLVRIQGTYVSDREVEQIVDFWRHAQPPEPPAPKDEQQRQEKPSLQQSEYEARNRELAARLATNIEQEKAAASEPASDDATTAYTPPAAFLSRNEQDELLPQALELVQQHKRASASLLQRRLRIGYSKAAQLIDLLEQQGVVGPAEGGRSREVIRHENGQPAEDEASFNNSGG